MFQSLRTGTPIYILYKKERKLAIGEVVEVSSPTQQFGMTYQNGLLAPPKSFVDIRVNIGTETINLQSLPADMTIADFGNTGMVVSENREQMTNEIDAFEATSTRALGEVDMHKDIVARCKEMRAQLNPQIAKEVEQAKEIEGLKADITEIKSLLKALGRNSSKKKTDNEYENDSD